MDIWLFTLVIVISNFFQKTSELHYVEAQCIGLEKF